MSSSATLLTLVQVLIATDVASRGLDIQTVNLVINYDMPQDVKVWSLIR